MLELAKNWILQNILEAGAEVCTQFITVFGNLIENIFGVVTTFNNDYLQGIDTFTSVFAIAFICFLTVKQYLMVYVFETSGDPESDPLDLLVRASQATAIASCAGTIFDMLDGFSSAFVADLQSVNISGDSVSSTGVADTLLDLLSIPSNFSNIPTVIMIITLAMIIAIIVFFIMAGKRGAELLFMKMMFPIFACDLTTTNREKFNAFFTSFLIVWLAYGLQLIAFKMFCLTLLKYTTCDLAEFPVVFSINIGWMIMMFKAPKWLQNFCYSSGIGGPVSGALRTLPYLLRAVR